MRSAAGMTSQHNQRRAGRIDSGCGCTQRASMSHQEDAGERIDHRTQSTIGPAARHRDGTHRAASAHLKRRTVECSGGQLLEAGVVPSVV